LTEQTSCFSEHELGEYRTFVVQGHRVSQTCNLGILHKLNAQTDCKTKLNLKRGYENLMTNYEADCLFWPVIFKRTSHFLASLIVAVPLPMWYNMAQLQSIVTARKIAVETQTIMKHTKVS